ncbi:MAG: AI-2E family transporter [Eisenbergiella sp.]
MKFRWDKKYLYWGITALLVIGASICLFFLMFRGANFKDGVTKIIAIAMPIIDGLVLAYLLTPVLNVIENKALKYIFKKGRQELSDKQRKYMRMSAVTLTLCCCVFIIYAFCSMVLPQLFKSIQSIVFQFPVYVNNLTEWLQKVLADNPDVETYINDLINTYTPELRSWMNDTLLPQMNAVLKVVSNYAFNVLKALWNMIIGLIISVYIMGSKEKFIGQAKKAIYAAFDIKRANSVIEDIRFVHRTFGGFISGKLLDSLIIGILCFAGTSIMGTPYPVLISVIIGVTNIVPFFGPYLGAIPSAILILMINPIQCLYFLLFILVLQQFDGNILGPKILGDSTGLSSFWVIFSITLFGGFMGVPGMVIGVPTFAVIYAMCRRRINRNLKKKDLPTETDEYKELGSIDEVSKEFIPNHPVPETGKEAKEKKNN